MVNKKIQHRQRKDNGKVCQQPCPHVCSKSQKSLLLTPGLSQNVRSAACREAGQLR